jgi:hypothetical protein
LNNYALRIKVKDGEIEKIFAELNQAQETIRECYDKLFDLGVLEIENESEDAPKTH